MQLGSDLHVTEDQLERYALNCSDENESDAVDEHLWACEQCQEQLLAEEAYQQAMQKAARRVRRRAAARGWRFVPAPAWAVALAALLVLTFMWRLSFQPPAGTPAVVVLQAIRGPSEPANPVPARQAFTLALDLTDLQPLVTYAVEIVNAAGHPVFQTNAAPDKNQVRTAVPRGLPTGMYYVRIYAPGNVLLREYGLHVGTR